MGVSIKVEGLKRVEKFLHNTSSQVFTETNKAVIKAGLFIEGEVKQSIAGHRAEPKSVDTGRFLNSVKSSQKAPLTSTTETNVPYANVLEYGTSKRQARRHFSNTAKRNEIKVKDFIEKEIKSII